MATILPPWRGDAPFSGLGVPVAEPLPTTPAVDDLSVTRRQAKKLFDGLLASDDRAVLLLLTQVLARLAEAVKA